MCGISGLWSPDGRSDLHDDLRGMLKALHHRGPDSQGVWIENGVGFAHNRLAIIDLSENGAQPMKSPSGRFVICLNGEIYNHSELRQNHLGHRLSLLKGTSDTEVLVNLIEHIGLDKTLTYIEGMYAFALWDNETKTLSLVRDRLGEKPLYYGKIGSELVFASELKAFKSHSGFNGEVDEASVYHYLKSRYIPSPLSIYQNIKKLPPGSYITGLSADQVFQATPKFYWRADRVAHSTSPIQGSDDEVISLVENELSEVFKKELVSDVPIGAFLSGGVDSSLVSALAQNTLNQKLRTFTIGFDVPEYDESAHAKEVAEHLRTDHTEWILSPKEALDLIPSMANFYDEPFSDPSQIPTTLLARMTRQQVTVALSGDGGDEVFGGYNRHLWAERIHRKLKLMPHSLRRSIAKSLQLLTPYQWDNIHNSIGQALKIPVSQLGSKIYKLADVIEARSVSEIYSRLQSNWDDPNEILLNPQKSKHLFSHGAALDDLSLTEQIMLMDSLQYLPDDILVKVDRATMAASLESRAPFLHHKIFELAWRLPLKYKIRNGQGKWILRQILDKYVPKHLVDRPKQGFAIPLNHWFKNELKEWVMDTLSPTQIKKTGLLKPSPIAKTLQEHMSGKKDHADKLWSLVILLSWQQN